MYQKTYHIHFIGIGGIGMSGIAELLLNLGYRVSGSDIRTSEITERLQRLGATIYKGHSDEHVKGANVVVVSSAIRPENPELVAARAALIPIIPRAEMLAELMRIKYGIAVAGAHGKTTTTSIIGAILEEAGFDPTMVVGGRLNSLGTNARLGEGDFIVAEADESDGSFLKLSPTVAVVTNIDLEHLDFYQDIDQIKGVFLDFINKVPFYGVSILCLDDEHIQDLIPKIEKRYVTYGLTPQADLQVTKIVFQGFKSRYSVSWRGNEIGRIELNLPGMHSIYNSLAGIAVAKELEIPFHVIKKALKNLEGVERRLQIKGVLNGVTVIDDYGHHPTEIKATLKTLRTCWPNHRLVVVFQPHRYTRTAALFKDFTRAFYQADKLIVLPIYPAGESPIDGISGQLLYEGIMKHGHKHVVFIERIEDVVPFLHASLQPGDILLTLGAGNIWRVGDEFLNGVS
nr:UDP-N-acetylmuramate--L-alanine ligase [Desulfobacterales bacterium]